MDFLRILMYIILVFMILVLCKAVWRRQRGVIVDCLLNIGIFVSLFLTFYPLLWLRGREPFLYGAFLALTVANVVLTFGLKRKQPEAPKPPAI